MTFWPELASAFRALDYHVDAVVGLIGAEAHAALARNSTVPAARALAGRDDPLAILTRLWLLQQPVPRAPLEQALPGMAEPLLAAGVLAADADRVRALVDLRPYATDDGNYWVAADLTPNLDTLVSPIRPDHVLGVSAASASLAQLTLRRPVGRALDLGTGCGVQSLHLAGHAGEVVATDLNLRAVELARITFALNQVDVDLRPGDLYAPVPSERFDLITTNPPYVMAPPGEARLTYREAGVPGDAVVERVVTEGADHLADDGVLQVLGSWAHVRGQDWTDRVGTWVPTTGCDAHLVQREVLDPYAYIEVWLADAGLTGSAEYAQRYATWCDYFDRLGIEAVGLGWLTLRRTGRTPSVRIEDWPHPVEQPIAPALSAGLDAVDRLSGMDDDQVLAGRWRLADDVVEETTGPPGAADPEHVVFRQQRGFRRAVALDTATAGILGACDGELTLAQIVASVASLLGVGTETLAAATVERVRTLVVDGFLR